jgi:hypothetical protein
MLPYMLFRTPQREISDMELATLLRDAIAAGASGLPRHADTFLAGLCADHLVNRMREAGLVVVKADDQRGAHPNTEICRESAKF